MQSIHITAPRASGALFVVKDARCEPADITPRGRLIEWARAYVFGDRCVQARHLGASRRAHLALSRLILFARLQKQSRRRTGKPAGQVKAHRFN